MKYTISEISSLLGVTTHMLRHYEKMGIINPEVDEKNGYRYYTVLDTRRFNMSRMLHSAGISLNTIADMLNGSYTPKEIENVMRRQIDELEKEQKRLACAKEYLQEQLETLPIMRSYLNRITIRYFDEPMWRLNFSDRETVREDQVSEEERAQWLAMMPEVKWVSKIPHEELMRFSTGEIHYEYGLMCRQSKAREFGLKRTENVEIIPAGDYACMLHTKVGRGPFTWEDIKKMSEYLSERGMKAFGDGFSTVVSSYMENREQVNTHELFVKIIND